MQKKTIKKYNFLSISIKKIEIFFKIILRIRFVFKKMHHA